MLKYTCAIAAFAASVATMMSCGAAENDTDTAPTTSVSVAVWRQDSTGCWEQAVESWPAEFWAEQASGECSDTDQDRYFTRDGYCYHVNGVCQEWLNDPAVDVCNPAVEPCCESDAVCPQ